MTQREIAEKLRGDRERLALENRCLEKTQREQEREDRAAERQFEREERATERERELAGAHHPFARASRRRP